MGQIIAMATDILDARPEDVYTTIADYHEGHPKILPPKTCMISRLNRVARAQAPFSASKPAFLELNSHFTSA